LPQKKDPRHGVIGDRGQPCTHGGGGGGRNAGGQDIFPAFRHAIENFDELLLGFSGGINHLGQAGAKGPVMVDLGELKVFVGHVGQSGQPFPRRRRALLDGR